MSDPVPPNVVTRNPSVVISVIVAVVNFLLLIFDPLTALLLVFGVVISPELAETIRNVLIVILTILGGVVVRAYVTPLVDPRNADGAPLQASYNYQDNKYAP